MEDGEEKIRRFHNRSSRRVQEHFGVSADNEHSDRDGYNESRGLKIAPPNSVGSTAGPLGTDFPAQAPGTPPPRPPLGGTTPARTLRPFAAAPSALRLALYLALALLALSAPMGAHAAATGTALGSSSEEVTRGRTFQFGGQWSRRPRARAVNKNCKEYDVTSRAFLADVIFEGTARSRSRRAPGRSVTFVIQKVLKQKGSLLRPKMQVRLHFGEKRGNGRPATGNPLDDCPLTSVTSTNRAMANVKVGEKYFVFADHFGPMNYTAKGEPIVVNRRNFKSIKSVLKRNKEKPPKVVGLQDLNLKTTQQLRLNCQVRGRPVPRINWFKDGAPLIPSSRVNVTYYRKNSTIEIKSVELKDEGVYECRATSVTGRVDAKSAHVSVWKFHPPSTTDPEKSFHIKKCSVDAYCLNGGQCYFIEHLGEHMCECEPGFKGARCEIKEVSAIGIKSYVCGFNIGYSSYYC